MATPITITPILKNESSSRFNKTFVAQQNIKISDTSKKRIESLVVKVLAKSKFSKQLELSDFHFTALTGDIDLSGFNCDDADIECD